jgi:hypothetical protein
MQSTVQVRVRVSVLLSFLMGVCSFCQTLSEVGRALLLAGARAAAHPGSRQSRGERMLSSDDTLSG